MEAEQDKAEALKIFEEEKAKDSMWTKVLLYSPCAAFLIILYFISNPAPDISSYLLFCVVLCICYVSIVHMIKQNCRRPVMTLLYIAGGVAGFCLMPRFLEAVPLFKDYYAIMYGLSVVSLPVMVFGYIIFCTWKEHNRNGLKRYLPSQNPRLKLNKKPVKIKVRIISDVHKRTFSEREPEKYGKIRKMVLFAGLPFFIVSAIFIPYIFNFTTDHNYMTRCVVFLTLFIGGVCMIRPVSES